MYAKYHYLQKQALKMLTLAIYHGDLIPADKCELCGIPKSEIELDGHHRDYSKPLDVIWVCRSCHKLEHGSYGKKASPQLDRALSAIRNNPDYLNLPARKLGELIGVSHSTANKAQHIIMEQG